MTWFKKKNIFFFATSLKEIIGVFHKTWHVITKQYFFQMKIETSNATNMPPPLLIKIYMFSICRCPSLQYHLWQLQEAWHHGNAMEMQSMLRLWPVHAVLHEQQARPQSSIWTLWDGPFPAVSTPRPKWSLNYFNFFLFLAQIFFSPKQRGK